MKLIYNIFLLYLMLNSSLLLAIDETDLHIKDVQIVGNSRVSTEYIFEALLSFKKNQAYTKNQLNADIKVLYASELFALINTKIENNILIISLQESPLVENVTFEGNDALKSDTLTTNIETQIKNTFSQSKIDLDIQKIVNLYYNSGYLTASVKYEIVEKENNRIDIVIKINEGSKTTINSILIEGNKEYLDSALLGLLASQDHKWWKFFTASDIYDKNKVLYDNELLRQFYVENGYPDFAVTSNFTEIDLEKGFILSYVIEEGYRYKFSQASVKIEIEELKSRSSEIEQSLSLINEGEWYKSSLVQKQLIALKNVIKAMGYQFIDVKPIPIYDYANRKIKILFEVKEQQILFVNHINISGNERTIDKVVRREMELSEKDAYDNDIISLSKRNLLRTGYFSAVDIKDIPSDEVGFVDLDVEVEEVSTGSISVGGGYSTIDQLQIEASYSETNLFGTGKYLSTNVSLSSNNSIYSVSLSDPYFLDKALYAGIYIYRRDSGANDYYDDNLYEDLEQGFSLSLGYNLSTNITQRWSYNFFYRNIYNVDPTSSLSIRQIEGTSFISSLGHTLSYNNTNSALFPTDGFDVSLYTEYAGLFGDIYYIKNTFKSIWYREIWEEVVFSALGSIGIIQGLNGQEVSLVDKYLVGGQTLRGFAIGDNYGGIGPIDAETEENLGGQYMFRGSLQLETPIPGVEQYGLLVYIFDDFGTVTDFSNDPAVIDNASLRMSIGFGLSWRSPAGIISLDVGFPILKESTDRVENVLLNFGTRF